MNHSANTVQWGILTGIIIGILTGNELLVNMYFEHNHVLVVYLNTFYLTKVDKHLT